MLRTLFVTLLAFVSSLANAQSGASDPVYLNDAVRATYFASVRCPRPSDPARDATNMMLVNLAAARELERRNPGMAPPEIQQILTARLNKVEATVNKRIDTVGCDAEEIRQLVDNFWGFSKRQNNAKAP
jgi:hypothetical protein